MSVDKAGGSRKMARGGPGEGRRARSAQAALKRNDAWAPRTQPARPNGKSADDFARAPPRIVPSTHEPKLADDEDAKRLEYIASHANAFNHKPGPDDIDQGGVGDCFFVAALAARARTDPASLRRNLGYRGSNPEKGLRFYDIVFYVRRDVAANKALLAKFPRAGPDRVDEWTDRDGHHRAAYTPVKVTVDDALPADKEIFEKQGKVTTRYADSHYADPLGHEIWVSLYEKAFARLQGGYDVLDQGGASADAMEFLSGHHTDEYDLAGTKESDAIFRRLMDAVAQKKMATMETYENGDKPTDGVLWALKKYNPPGPDGKPMFDPLHFKYTDMDMLDDDNGWTENHAYTVLRAWVNARGVKMVELRDPGGDVRPPKYSDGKRDGHAVVPWNVARALFQAVYVGDGPALSRK